MNAAAAEALADPRVGPVSEAELAAEARALGRRPRDGAELERVRRDRPIEWAARPSRRARSSTPSPPTARANSTTSRCSSSTPLRLSLALAPRAEHDRDPRRARSSATGWRSEGPALLLGPIGPKTVERFLDDETLRSRVAVLDLARLEKIAAVRSSVFVYLEWFLRDDYGVKILAESAFTRPRRAGDHLARHGLSVAAPTATPTRGSPP